MPRDLFAELGITVMPDKPHDLFSDIQQVKDQSENKKGFALRNPISKFLEDIQTAANSPGIHGLQGAQDSLRELMTLGLVPIKPQAEGTAYNIGKGIGDIAGFVGGGELADLGRLGLGATKLAGIPGVKKGLDILEMSPTLKRTLGSIGFGAAANPEDREEGALYGAALGGLGELGRNFGPNIIENLRPAKETKNLLETLGKGKNLEENAKSIAKDISDKYKEHKNISSKNYGLVFDTHDIGNRKVSIPRSDKENRFFPREIVNTFDDKLEDLYTDFVKNPSIKNAHDLQSQFGSSIRKLQKLDNEGKLTLADQKILGKYRKAQDYVKSSIQNTLEAAEREHGIPFQELYNQANSYHLNNVVPYKEDLKISKISSGKIKIPRNIQNIFKNPEDNIQKIVEHLGDEFKNKVLYSELAKYKTPEKLISAVTKLDEKGLNQYLNPEISNQLKLIGKKVGNKNIARTLAGALGGAAVGQMLPIPFAKDVAPLAGAVLATPGLQNALSAILRTKGR